MSHALSAERGGLETEGSGPARTRCGISPARSTTRFCGIAAGLWRQVWALLLTLALTGPFPGSLLQGGALPGRPQAPGRTPRDASAPAGLGAEAYADRGIEHFYSAEFGQARELYRKALELDPKSPRDWAGLADSDLFQLLLAARRLDAQLYGESNEFLQAKTPEPDPALLREMNEALAQARRLSEQRLAANPNDAEAHYALGLAYAVESNYDFSLARKYWDALRASARAKAQHERVRHLDPANHDANLVIGAYEYAVGSVPAAVRWVLYLAGYAGSKQRGFELVRDTAQNGRRNAPAAITLLGLFYAREKRYPESRQMFRKMLELYPRNYIAEMQIAGIYRRESNLAAAVATYQDVAHKTEARAPGFERVEADRLYFDIGSLLEEQGRPDEALEAYRTLTTLKQKNARLEAESELRMGDLYRGQGQPALARQAYENARQTPFPDIQRQAAARLRSLK